MIGMNATTGRALTGLAHLYQSIAQIVTTPRGSRLQRRAFGSSLFELIDAPANTATRLRVYAALATAIMRYEPRLQLRRVALVEITSTGTVVFEIEGVADAGGEAVTTRVPVALGGQA
ncbi:MAG: GPW/gp25 family protein [Duganella sp.]